MTKSEYRLYLETDHWKSFRRKVYARINSCAACSTRKDLNIHHRNYNCLYNETMKDIIVLCRACHGNLHKSVQAGAKQKAWLRDHCPKLFNNHIKDRSKKVKSKPPKWFKGVQARLRQENRPVKVSPVRSNKKEKTYAGVKFNTTMGLEEWKRTHPNAV